MYNPLNTFNSLECTILSIHYNQKPLKFQREKIFTLSKAVSDGKVWKWASPLSTEIC